MAEEKDMDIKIIFDQCLKRANGNVCDFLFYIYESMKKEQGREALLFQQFIEQSNRNVSFDKDKEMVSMTKRQFAGLLNKYNSLVRGYVDYLVAEGLEEKVFYERLWAFMHNTDIFPNIEASKIAFVCIYKHPLVPYFYFSDYVCMEEEEYHNYSKQIQLQRDKIEFALQYRFTQRTEQASVIWTILNELSDENQRIVLLSYLLSYIKKSENYD